MQLDPNLSSLGLGLILIAKSEYDLAIQSLNDAIRKNPKSALAHNALGNAYNIKGDYDRAIEAYTAAIEADPQFAFAFRNRGAAYGVKREHDRADRRFRPSHRDQSELPRWLQQSRHRARSHGPDRPCDCRPEQGHRSWSRHFPAPTIIAATSTAVAGIRRGRWRTTTRRSRWIRPTARSTSTAANCAGTTRIFRGRLPTFVRSSSCRHRPASSASARSWRGPASSG